MPLPYMGSKRKSAHKIYTIINNSRNNKKIVDLFCGGFSISEYFLRNSWNVRSNDLNEYVIALLDLMINKGVDENIEEKMLKFITMEEFKIVLDNKSKYEKWYVGYVMTVWSFGNNQKNYLFGKNTEETKNKGHNLVIYKDKTALKEIIPQKYIQSIIKLDTWQKRRIGLKRVCKELQKRSKYKQQLEQLQRLELTALDYWKVKIEKEYILYCDPPYKGTSTYFKDEFDHNKYWKWVREKSKTNLVYTSEYSAPDDFVAILEFEQKSTLQGGVQKHNNQPNEKLFVHKSLINKL